MFDFETLFNASDSRTRAALDRLRERFLEHFDCHPELYDDRDVQENLINCDLYLHRFLINEHGKEEAAFEKLKTCFKWRKDTEITYLTEQSFPIEFYQTGCLFSYPSDRDGSPMLYIRIRVIKKCAELEEYMKLFLAYHINKIDSQVRKLQGWSIVFDCSGMGIANVQLGMLKYLVHTIRDYFPCGVKYILIYEIPWVLSGVQKMVFAMLPEEERRLLQFRNRQNIHKLIPRTYLPHYMGGGCAVNYCRVPTGCKPFRSILASKYSDKELDRMACYFRSIANDNDLNDENTHPNNNNN